MMLTSPGSSQRHGRVLLLITKLVRQQLPLQRSLLLQKGSPAPDLPDFQQSGSKSLGLLGPWLYRASHRRSTIRPLQERLLMELVWLLAARYS